MEENKQPILSICVPTYNREKCLRRLLDSIVFQKEFIDTNDVEVVISDNASTDSTKELVNEYVKKYWNKIKFFQNKENIWMRWNLYKVPSLWTWKYLWWMWSDQKLNSNGIWIMLKWLKKCEVKTVVVSNSEYDSLSLIFNGFSDFSTYIWQHKKDFLEIEGWLLTFMSYCCMSREYFLKTITFLKSIMDEEKIINNYFNFSLIRYSQLYWNDSILYIRNHVFIPVSDAESSWTINRKIVKDLLFIINYIENNYFVSKSAKKVFKNIKRIWRGAYMALPLKKLCKLIYLEKLYQKLAWLYRLFFVRQ